MTVVMMRMKRRSDVREIGEKEADEENEEDDDDTYIWHFKVTHTKKEISPQKKRKPVCCHCH